jgi:GT2 family glycosyltransferase
MPEGIQPSSILTGNQQTVCAVVVTHNRLALLKECVAGLRSQTRRPEQILIVNNASTDGTVEWLAGQDDLWVIHQENLGASGGFYRGMKEAASSESGWIWVMDDDVRPDNGCLLELLRAAQELGPNVVMVPNRLADGKPLLAEPVIIDCSTFTQDYGPVRIRNVATRPLSPQPLRIEGFTFEGPLFPATVVAKVGLPDPSYFLIGDDLDYAIRCKGRFRAFFVPTAVLTRQLPEQKPTSITTKDYYQVRNNYTSIPLKYGVFPSKYVRPLIRALAFARNRFIIHRVPLTWGGVKLLFLGLFDGYCGRLGKRS